MGKKSSPSEIETSKDDEGVRERLVKENQDKDALINSQQNELNKASSTIARLRDDIEKKDKEMKRMGDRIESLEDKIISVATENKKEAESKAEPQESQSVPQAEKKMVDTVAVPQNMQAVANGIPVYYQIPVVDGTGNVVQRLPIERSVRKSSNSGVASLFATPVNRHPLRAAFSWMSCQVTFHNQASLLRNLLPSAWQLFRHFLPSWQSQCHHKQHG